MFDLGEKLVLGFEWYIVLVFSMAFHEAAHALVAMWLGDRTAYYGGQVSLDPTPHIRREPIGMVTVPIVSFFLNRGEWMMGWASAPYDPHWAGRYPKRAALMALAGPVSNLILALVAGGLIRAGLSFELLGPSVPGASLFTHLVSAPNGGFMTGVAIVLSIFFTLNLALCIFNLLPLPPLDGSALPPLVLDRSTSARYLEFSRSPGFALLGLVVAWQVFPHMYIPVFRFALRILLWRW